MKIITSSPLIQSEKLATVLFEPNSPIADVVLVHGFTGSKEDFTEVAEIMAKNNFRVLTFDNRGQHESSHSERVDAYSMASIGKDVIEISNYFKMNKPHLLGHSFGGLISQQAVVQAPHDWKSLTLMCSGPGGQTDWINDPVFDQILTQSMEEVWNKFIDVERKVHPRYEIHKNRWIASDGRSTSIFRDHLNSQPSLIQEIAKLSLPVHVLYGENDDAWPLELQNQMAKDLQSKLTVLPNCGHTPNEDNPQLTAEALMSFWKSI